MRIGLCLVAVIALAGCLQQQTSERYDPRLYDASGGVVGQAGAPVAAAGPACHEAQQTVTIDGRAEPAHMTVCRQPDGSWRKVAN